MNITLLKSTGKDSVTYYIQELPGTYATASNWMEALAQIPTEFRLYRAWCGLSTKDALCMDFAEEIKNNQVFAADSKAWDKETYETMKALALRTVEDTYTIMAAAKKNSISAEAKKAVAEVYQAFGFEAGSRNYAAARKAFFATVEKDDTLLKNKKKAGWTLAKAFRILMATDRRFAKKIFLSSKDSDKLPDPFFFGDDTLTFNMTTFV